MKQKFHDTSMEARHKSGRGTQVQRVGTPKKLTSFSYDNRTKDFPTTVESTMKLSGTRGKKG